MRFLLAVPAIAAAAYFLLALICGMARAYRRRSEANVAFTPPVSILKPIRGLDPHFSEAIRSYARQDYPEFELLFGVADPSDPAVPEILELEREFPHRRIRVIISTTQAPNGKVGVLTDLSREARHPLLSISDSDIQVEPEHLRQTVGPLADPAIGLVTCLYRATSDSLPGRWEALGVSTDFAPGVLVAPIMGVSGFAMGSTMVVRAADLRRAGGFERLADYLADDYHLGRIITDLGLRVHLSFDVVATHLSGGSWRQVWRHAIRWSRTIRMSRTAGYYGYLVTHATLWSAVAWLAGFPMVAFVSLLSRVLAGVVVGWVILGDRHAATLVWALPGRDLWGTAVWICGLFGKSVEWRGLHIRLNPDGRIEAPPILRDTNSI